MEKAQKNIWTVGALGLASKELNLLKSLVNLTHSRVGDGYTICDAQDSVGSCNILILNADDEEATSEWHFLADRQDAPVAIFYGAEPPADPGRHYLSHPFGPAKLLALLDKIGGQLRESAQVWSKPALFQPGLVEVNHAEMLALVVDDSPTVCKQLELELRNFNIKAETAETGERGLELIATQQYDIIFLDVVLPGTDGYSICKEIRRDSRTKQTPVIMLTSKSSPFDRVRGSLAGCNAYLTKPVDYHLFRETVEKHLRRAASHKT